MSEQAITTYSHHRPIRERLTGIVISVTLVIFVVAFSIWSGIPRGGRALPFFIGVGFVALLLLAFGWITWHLIFRPLPAGKIIRGQQITAGYRQAMALLLGVGGVGFIVGGFWDEVWHRQYGIPFGEDFFWRPHLLIYFGILVTPALAFAGLVSIMRRGRGTLQQRFRADPMIGLLILVGGLFMVVVPADPIWHMIYGEDITAWSVPHLLLLASIGAILLLATAIHMTTQSRRAWGTARQLRGADALPLGMFAATSLIWNQFFTTEWDGGATYVLARPEWLLPVVIVSGASFIGVMANHTLRVWGTATLSGLLALGLRVGLIELFHVSAIMRVNAWVLILPSLLLIDLWYAYRQGAWAGAGVAAALGMAVALPTLYPQFYALYPIRSPLVTLMMVALASVVMSRIGAALGNYVAGATTQAHEVAGQSRLPLVSFAVAVGVVAFIFFFVTTATAPA